MTHTHTLSSLLGVREDDEDRRGGGPSTGVPGILRLAAVHCRLQATSGGLADGCREFPRPARLARWTSARRATFEVRQPRRTGRIPGGPQRSSGGAPRLTPAHGVEPPTSAACS